MFFFIRIYKYLHKLYLRKALFSDNGLIVKVDCFEKCTSHVASTLPESTWKVWARAIASSCSNISAQADTLNQR